MAGVNFRNFNTMFRVNSSINHVLFSREKVEKENFRNFTVWKNEEFTLHGVEISGIISHSILAKIS